MSDAPGGPSNALFLQALQNIAFALTAQAQAMKDIAALVAPPTAGVGIEPGSIIIITPGLGYAVGDSITLACVGATATTPATVAVNQVGGGGVPLGINLTNTGVYTITPLTAGVFTQIATSGAGTGLVVGGSFAPIAAALSSPTLTTGGSAFNGNFWIGGETPAATLGGAENTFAGDRAGGAFTGAASGNTALGHNAGGIFGAIPPDGSGSTFLGNDSGRNISGTANSHTAAGQNSLRVIDNGSAGDSAFGYHAGINVSTGSHNVIIGDLSAPTLTTGNYNIVIGSGADVAAAGSNYTINMAAGSTSVISATGCDVPATSNTSVAGNFGSHGPVKASDGYTIAAGPNQLPVAGVAGRRAFVTDQVGACAAPGVALTPGGALVCPVFDNGVAWVGG